MTPIAAAPAPGENMGKPEKRLDGRLKVTGGARYASDQQVSNPLHAYLITSSIARGEITAMKLDAAKALPGVAAIYTHENMAPVGKFAFFAAGGESGTKEPPLASKTVHYDGEIIGMVVADTYETAREAAHLVEVAYKTEKPAGTLKSEGLDVVLGQDVSKRVKNVKAGDFAGAFAAGEVTLQADYAMASQAHNAIELFATTCAWDGDRLTVYEPSQWVTGAKFGLARQLAIDPANVHIVSPYLGGAFGSKGSLTQRTSLVARAAKLLGRPVKLVVTREQGFSISTYRAETKHRVRLAATKDGKLTAYGHDATELTSRTDDYGVGGVKITTAMYDAPNVEAVVHLARADRATPGFMRSPAEVPYIFALESAMDEMAAKLGMDPIEFRRKNDTMKNVVTGAPYTSRSLMKCFDEAAKAFGWEKRKQQPGTVRDGDWLVGYGCALACYPTQMMPSSARVTLSANGSLRVQVAAHEVGQGVITALGQFAAERLGVPLSRVQVEVGDSALPPGPIAGGSVTTASAGSAVAKAADAIKAKLGPDFDASGPEAIAKAFSKMGVGSIEEYAEWAPDGAPEGALAKLHQGVPGIVGGPMKDRTMFAFGAEFVEVRVHALTREVRVPKMVGAFAAGRILNTRTTRSQLMGGMIWGLASALHEGVEVDERTARLVNDNIAEYLVPVNADIGEVEVILVPEVDDKVNPIGVKGVGELGNVGTDAAVANAVFNATGVRIRELPIRIEKLLGA